MTEGAPRVTCPVCPRACSLAEGQLGLCRAWRAVAPDELAETAASLRDRGNIGVAYTYNEPLVGYEFVRDTARAARYIVAMRASQPARPASSSLKTPVACSIS